MTEHTIADHNVTIRPVRGFSSKSTRYTFMITFPNGLTDANGVRYLTEDAALAAATRIINGNIRTCSKCDRPATRTASLGPACDEHYDDLAG